MLLLVGGLVWYVVGLSRDAYIGARFTAACGGKAPAARLLARVEDQNEALLAGGLAAAAFGMHKTQHDRTDVS